MTFPFAPIVRDPIKATRHKVLASTKDMLDQKRKEYLAAVPGSVEPTDGELTVMFYEANKRLDGILPMPDFKPDPSLELTFEMPESIHAALDKRWEDFQRQYPESKGIKNRAEFNSEVLAMLVTRLSAPATKASVAKPLKTKKA